MNTFKLNSTKYEIPENWYDIKLNTFLKIRELEKKRGDLDEIDYNLSYTSILTGIPVDDLLNLEPQKLGEILSILMGITSKSIDIIPEPIWKYNGETYVMDKNTEKMILGRFIDLDTINKQGDVWENGHKIAASFLRKAKPKFRLKFTKNPKCSDYYINKYDWDELVKDSEIFLEHLPMPYIYTIVVFFCLIKKKSEKITKDYLNKIEVKN